MTTNPWWVGRTSDIERMRQGVSNGNSPEVVDASLANMTRQYFGDKHPPLCGNSVHGDKLHIDAELPIFASRLDYRIIDITSLKLIADIYRGVRYDSKSYHHYALDDIRESVDELKFLLNALGITDLSELSLE